jgi:uncharacterized protein YggE
MQPFIQKYQAVIIRVLIVIAVLLGLLLLVAIAGQVKSYKYIGSGLPAANTITVEGNGKVEKAPDTAKFSFTVQDEEKDTTNAQTVVSKKVAQVKSDLLAAGVASADITTNSYNSYPDYQQGVMQCFKYPCPPAPQVLKGYIVSQSVNVSVKDLSKTETVAGLLGKDGVTSIDGPNLGFADANEVADAARDMAIADAKVQAEKLADSLGVRLVRIVSFNDNKSGGGVVPMMYNKTMGATALDATAPAPSIPTGVQTVNDTVSITYEIR